MTTPLTATSTEEDYNARVSHLEGEGCTTSDAQSAADAELLNAGVNPIARALEWAHAKRQAASGQRRTIKVYPNTAKGAAAMRRDSKVRDAIAARLGLEEKF